MSDSPRAPEASFLTILYTMGTQAMIALGELPSPVTRQQKFDPRHAKWQLDTLEILLEKTAGNLSSEEEEALLNVLTDVREKWQAQAGETEAE